VLLPYDCTTGSAHAWKAWALAWAWRAVVDYPTPGRRQASAASPGTAVAYHLGAGSLPAFLAAALLRLSCYLPRLGWRAADAGTATRAAKPAYLSRATLLRRADEELATTVLVLNVYLSGGRRTPSLRNIHTNVILLPPAGVTSPPLLLRPATLRNAADAACAVAFNIPLLFILYLPRGALHAFR